MWYLYGLRGKGKMSAPDKIRKNGQHIPWKNSGRATETAGLQQSGEEPIVVQEATASDEKPMCGASL